MIKVFIWRPTTINVGHSSAEVGNVGDAGHSYISWWPSGADIIKPNPGRNNSFEEDVAAEGREPDEQREIIGLDEDLAAKWWRDFLDSDLPSYKLTKNNCSWAVVSALKAGGADEKFPWFRLAEKHNISYPSMPGAGAFIRYLVSVLKIVRSGETWQFAVKRPLVDIGDELSPIWSPSDVLYYCDLLIAGIEGTDFLDLTLATNDNGMKTDA